MIIQQRVICLQADSRDSRNDPGQAIAALLYCCVWPGRSSLWQGLFNKHSEGHEGSYTSDTGGPMNIAEPPQQ